jgi:hypothetical protein
MKMLATNHIIDIYMTVYPEGIDKAMELLSDDYIGIEDTYLWELCQIYAVDYPFQNQAKVKQVVELLKVPKADTFFMTG